MSNLTLHLLEEIDLVVFCELFHIANTITFLGSGHDVEKLFVNNKEIVCMSICFLHFKIP